MPFLEDSIVFGLFLMNRVFWFLGQLLVGKQKRKMFLPLVGEFRNLFCARGRVRGQRKPSLGLRLERLADPLELFPL